MQGFRALFAVLPLILTAGALLLLILTLLAGGVSDDPITKFYYLQASLEDSAISSPDMELRWTNYNVCGVDGDTSVNCGSIKAAYGFDPIEDLPNVDSSSLDSVRSHQGKLRDASKAFFSFLLIAAFFTAVAMFASVAGCFGRLGATIGLIITFVAWVMCTVAASLMTYVYVTARNDLRSDGVQASLGVKLFAFVWTAVACLMLALLIFLIGACIPSDTRKRSRKARSFQEKPLVIEDDSYHPVEPVYIAPEPTSVYGEAPRSSYERVTPRTGGALAAPLDTTVHSGQTGATYIR